MKIAFLISEYLYYETHRKSLINYILSQDKNNIVYVITNFNQNKIPNNSQRLKFIDLDYSRNKIHVCTSTNYGYEKIHVHSHAGFRGHVNEF